MLKQIFIPHSTNGYRPHLIRRHGLAFAVLLVIGSYLVQGLQSRTYQRVLGYASNISISGLLAETNAQRAAAGKSPLSVSAKLNTAAQGKANHMITQNYWAHTSPDGVTPWYWFDYAGYDYLVAGENLAYGFDTSSGVINGWMNSPTHRDNMLNSAYEEIGFGIANGENYQGGPNTIVVAHYGDPAISTESSPPPTPPTTPAVPQNTSTLPSITPLVEEPPAHLAEEPAETPSPQLDQPIEIDSDLNPAPEIQPQVEIAPSNQRRFTNFEALLSGQATWSLYVAAVVAISIGFVYLYRHILFIHKTIVKGENYLIHHPMLEASIIYALIWLLLAGSFGSIL